MKAQILDIHTVVSLVIGTKDTFDLNLHQCLFLRLFFLLKRGVHSSLNAMVSVATLYFLVSFFALCLLSLLAVVFCERAREKSHA